ncbi:DUF5615 family PIN-like protein [candidate division KSB1 bacterium]|nr:DUF5615 family PIN-like protein [candidate division KSB1 bacterium]
MIFYLDENIPKPVIAYLQSLGHKVVDIRNTELEGSDDITLFEKAQDNNAIFLTTDKDFFHTIPQLFQEHHGVIVITLKQPNRRKLLEKIRWVLNNIDLNDLNSKVLLLKDRHYSIYEN